MALINKDINLSTNKKVLDHILYYMMIDDIDDIKFSNQVIEKIEAWIEENQIYDINKLYGPYYIGNLDCANDIRIKSNLMPIDDKEKYRKLLRQDNPKEIFGNDIKFLVSITTIEISFTNREKTTRYKNRESNIRIIFSIDKL